ncbi:hypothetical protein BT93_L1936 [Corymbia citriodora subsp. variegata]|uniref:Uncharacterized protein n=1 Tax=Corymbia citriodora subsp. variegata TaxID=360336 RepID=A0A8T0CLK3_CORYI|nr:hypothetical protein BT93_L1936 [Corymbia citriodora subsp. variegata]
MESMQLPSRFVFFLFLFIASFVWVFPDMAMAQATTDPLEVKALNRVFQQWNLAAPPNEWNISGEPCSGVALSTASIDEAGYKPYIRCVCFYDNGSTCHITQLRIYSLNVVGSIPKELWSLSYLTYLNLESPNRMHARSLQVGVMDLTECRHNNADTASSDNGRCYSISVQFCLVNLE